MTARIGHRQIGADLRKLLFHRPHTVGSARDLLLDEARSVGVLVAMDQAYELRMRTVSAVRRDMKADGVAGLQRKSIGVAEEFDLCHAGAGYLSRKRNARGS